jgi:hypothetical protein
MYYSIIASVLSVFCRCRPQRTGRIRQTGNEEQIMPDKPENGAVKLLSSRKTLVMATADKSGTPNVSYAPFVHRAPLAPHGKYDGNCEGERHVHRR